MTSKEALDFLNGLISREKHIDSERNKKIIERYNLIKKDLDRLESLERENKLLKKYLKEYQEYIKKGVEEHYEDFMSDYDLLLQECQELNKKLLVLDILKAKVFHKMACFDLDSGWYDDSFFLDENELKIIKEWLENE